MDDFIEVAGGSEPSSPPLLPSPKETHSSSSKKGLFLGLLLVLLLASGALGVMSVQKGGFNILKKAQETDPCADPKPTPAAWPNYGDYSVSKTTVVVGETITISNITGLQNVTKCKVGYRLNPSGSWTTPSGGGIKNCSDSFTFSFPTAGQYYVIVAAYNSDCSYSCSTKNYYAHGVCGEIEEKCGLPEGPCSHSSKTITVTEPEEPTPTSGVPTPPTVIPTPTLACPSQVSATCTSDNSKHKISFTSSAPLCKIYGGQYGTNVLADVPCNNKYIEKEVACGTLGKYSVVAHYDSSDQTSVSTCPQKTLTCSCPTGTVTPVPSTTTSPSPSISPSATPTNIPGTPACTSLTAENLDGELNNIKVGDTVKLTAFFNGTVLNVGFRIIRNGTVIENKKASEMINVGSSGLQTSFEYDYHITQNGSYEVQVFLKPGGITY